MNKVSKADSFIPIQEDMLPLLLRLTSRSPQYSVYNMNPVLPSSPTGNTKTNWSKNNEEYVGHVGYVGQKIKKPTRIKRIFMPNAFLWVYGSLVPMSPQHN